MEEDLAIAMKASKVADLKKLDDIIKKTDRNRKEAEEEGNEEDLEREAERGKKLQIVKEISKAIEDLKKQPLNPDPSPAKEAKISASRKKVIDSDSEEEVEEIKMTPSNSKPN